MNFCDSSGERNAGQERAYKMFIWAMVSYGAALPISFGLMKRFRDWPGHLLFLLLPLAGVVLILRSMMLFFSAADEMQRRILSEAACLHPGHHHLRHGGIWLLRRGRHPRYSLVDTVLVHDGDMGLFGVGGEGEIQVKNRVRDLRSEHAWSQADLARPA